MMSAQPMPTPDVSWMDGREAAQWVCVVAGIVNLDEVRTWGDDELILAVRVIRAVQAKSPGPWFPGVDAALAHIAAKGFA